MPKKQSPVSIAIKTKFTKYLMGYVAGFMYKDDFEWLFSNTGWSYQHGGPREQVKILTSREKAIAHAQKFKGTMENYKVFTRGYVYESPAPQELPLYNKESHKKIFIN